MDQPNIYDQPKINKHECQVIGLALYSGRFWGLNTIRKCIRESRAKCISNIFSLETKENLLLL